MFLTLHVADDRIAAAHNARWVIELSIAFPSNVILLYLDHAQRHLLPVRHVHGGWHRIVGVSEIVGIDPAFNENKDRGPGIRPNLRICERAHRSSLGRSRRVAIGLGAARPRIAFPDAVSSDRRGDNILLVHEMPVEMLAGSEQIAQRQEGEIILQAQIVLAVRGGVVRRMRCKDACDGGRVETRFRAAMPCLKAPQPNWSHRESQPAKN